jgi:hypothetical protein
LGISKFNINNNRLTQDELEIIKEQYLDEMITYCALRENQMFDEFLNVK